MLSLLLLQHALAPSTIDAHTRSRLPVNAEDNPSSTDVGSRPYLKVASLTSLRIKAVPPPPDLISKPAAGAPPQPLPAAPADNLTAAPDSLTEPAIKPVDIAPAKPLSPEPAPVPSNPPAPILPDDTHPSTRPEDFLPFFLFPGANQGVNVVVPVTPTRPPAPNQAPPSSATYQQK